MSVLSSAPRSRARQGRGVPRTRVSDVTVRAGLPGPLPEPVGGQGPQWQQGDSRVWGRDLRDLVSRCQGRQAEHRAAALDSPRLTGPSY